MRNQFLQKPQKIRLIAMSLYEEKPESRDYLSMWTPPPKSFPVIKINESVLGLLSHHDPGNLRRESGGRYGMFGCEGGEGDIPVQSSYL